MHSLLAQLAERRPVFHSEADFQHALAWQCKLSSPEAEVRLEKQVTLQGSRAYLDLLVHSGKSEIAIELKYKVRAVKIVQAKEEYLLRNQSAQDIGRHDFLKDIERLENYVEEHTNSAAYAIMLTNDRTYWTESKKNDTVDTEFRLHEGKTVQGGATWGAKAAKGTKHKREAPISLRGKYSVHWCKYWSFGPDIADEFRYLLIHVPGYAVSSLNKSHFQQID